MRIIYYVDIVLNILIFISKKPVEIHKYRHQTNTNNNIMCTLTK